MYGAISDQRTQHNQTKSNIMPPSAIKGQEIIFLWDSPIEKNKTYVPYERYVIIVKYGSPFIWTDLQGQIKESIGSIFGEVFEIDGHTIAEKGTGGYLTGLDKNGEKRNY